MFCRRIVKRVLSIAFSVLAVLLLSGGVYLYYTQPIALLPKKIPHYTALDLDRKLTAEQARADAEQMVRFVEEVHPAFLNASSIPAGYENSRGNYLSSVKKPMTVSAFTVLTEKFLCSVRDGHTSVFWPKISRLAVDWKWKDGSLWSGSGTSLPEGAQIRSVGGVSAETVFSAVDSLIPAENEAAVARNRETYTGDLSVLREAGVDVSRPVRVEAVTPYGTVSRVIPFVREENPAGAGASPIHYGQKDGAFLVTMKSCEMGKDLDDTVSALKNAVAKGTRKVILDVRENPGGNSNACLALLQALGMQPGEYGGTIRFSGPAAEQRGYLRRGGSISFSSEDSSVKNSKISLSVLTDSGTFSSATMLAVWVQDGHLGRVVGQPSANAPSSYGDIIYFKLTNSGLYGSVSHKKWSRPDQSANQNELVPDIIVPDGQDALETALNIQP